MLIIVTAVTIASWLVLWAVLAARTSRRLAAAVSDGPPQGRGSEPPAVVSLLAGRLESLGYPATLLDLAARGFFRLEGRPGGPVMCVLGGNVSGAELTGYERQAFAHVMIRAGSRLDVPAVALADGFAAPDASDRGMKSARDAFMEAFRKDVIEDSRRRGLTRPRLSEPAGCLLWVAALVPAVASGLALHADRSHAYWIPVVGFLVLCALAGMAVKGEKLTPAGRAALRGWRDSCPSLAGTDFVASTAFVAAQRPPRQVAYAAALGRARTAVSLFAGTSGEPRGKTIWSSYGGSWRQITIGDPQPRGFLQAGGVLLMTLAIVLLALVPATIATVVLAHGELRAAAFAVLVCDAVIVLVLLTKDASSPGFAEFDGQVVEAWLEEESGENSTTTYQCLAIDDGVRDRAWVFAVTETQYRTFAPGTPVHARVNPRRNKLLDISPLTDPAGQPRGYGRADLVD
jgi:hypothetical protein